MVHELQSNRKDPIVSDGTKSIKSTRVNNLIQWGSMATNPARDLNEVSGALGWT